MSNWIRVSHRARMLSMTNPRKRLVFLAVMAALTMVTIAFFHHNLHLQLRVTFKQFIQPRFSNLTRLKTSALEAIINNDTATMTDLRSTVAAFNQTLAVNGLSGVSGRSMLTKVPPDSGGASGGSTLTEAPPGPREKRKKMVYACRSGGCGGWADRQKGIVSTYVLAAILDRDFGIHITFPCDLGNILNVNKIDWRVTEKELQGPNSNQYRILDHQAVVFAKQLTSRQDLGHAFPQDVSVVTWNMEVVQYLQQHELASRISWLAGKPHPEVYRQALKELFSLKPDVQKQLDELQNSRPPGTQLVCAQMRLGKHNGSFPDVESWHSFRDFGILVDFLAKYNDSSKFRVFFASDSVEIIERAKAKFPEVFLHIRGPITHTDKSYSRDACDGFKKAILDEYALSLCDVLVISESGIGKVASFMRGSDQQLYLFHGVKIEPFTRGGQFPNKSGW